MSDPTIERLIARLSYSDYGTRRRATDDLIALGEAAVPALLDVLEGRSHLACVRAVEALGQIGCAEAIPALHTLLETERDASLLTEVIGALHRIRTQQAESPQARAWVSDALAAYDRRVEKASQNGPRLPTQEELLARYQEQQRLAALARPISSGSGTLQRPVPSEISALLQALRDPSYDRGKAVVQQLVQLGEAAVEPLLTADLSPLAQQRAARALGQIGDPRALDYLILRYRWAINENTNADYDLTGAVSGALVEFATRLATEPTPDRLPALLTLIRELHTIHQAAATAAAYGLVDLANNHPGPELRQALPLLKGSLFQPVPLAFGRVRKAIEAATAPWKDLPLTAAPPQEVTSLPRPASEAPDA